MTLECRVCGLVKPLAEMCRDNRVKNPRRGECKACKRARSRGYDPEKKRDIVLRFRYGITSAEADALLAAQGGVCAICRRPPKVGGKNVRLYVDHDHETGAVRGLLCPPCNTGLEWTIRYNEAAADYLAAATVVSDSGLGQTA